MKKLKFEVPEYRQLEINGHVFDILKSDSDVMMKAEELRNRYAGLASRESVKDTGLSEIIDAVKSVISYIDEMLGEGATAKITAGKPLGIVPAIQLMTLICQAVVEEYNVDVQAKYS